MSQVELLEKRVADLEEELSEAKSQIRLKDAFLNLHRGTRVPDLEPEHRDVLQLAADRYPDLAGRLAEFGVHPTGQQGAGG